MAKWMETDMKSPLQEMKGKELPIRAAGLKYGIPESTIWLRMKQFEVKDEFVPVAPGRK